MIVYDLCAGSSATARACLGGLGSGGLPRIVSPVAWTGTKDRWVWRWQALLGVEFERASRIVVVDPGPWGRTWEQVVFDGAATVCRILWGWEGEDPIALWCRLRDAGEPTGPAEWVASWLWLQARSVNGAPLWWREGRLVQDGGGMGVRENRRRRTGHRVQKAQPRSTKPRGDGGGGLRSPETIARRLEAVASHARGRLQVLRMRAEDVEPEPGAIVTLDPPYQAATRYADEMGREAVIATCLRWQAAGARALVCEREPLDLPGWAWHDLSLRPDRREWVGVAP